MTPTCPACGSTRVRPYPPSRVSGWTIAGCSSCRTRWLTDPPTHDEVIENYDFDREVFESYVGAKRTEALDADMRSTLTRLTQLIRSGGRSLFDVGAGAGEFLALAQAAGFEPHGNEFAPGAIELTKERTGVELHRGDLAGIEGTNLYDAMTMWCVLAHVADQDALLSDALRLLKPGGVLFLQTPRYSGMDVAGVALARGSRGRWPRLLDRRINEHHMTLYSVTGLKARCQRIGFDIVAADPRSRYSLKTDEYLRSLGMPARATASASRALDVVVDRDLFFRNVIDLYLRKPA